MSGCMPSAAYFVTFFKSRTDLGLSGSATCLTARSFPRFHPPGQRGSGLSSIEGLRLSGQPGAALSISVPSIERPALDKLLRAFRHRSGRVIALTRVVLALVFFLAVWIDPAQPARSDAFSYALLGAYVALSFVLIVITWSNWSIDHALAKVSHVIDVAVFLFAVYATEGYTSTFTSPFFGFFAFLVLGATLRWGWRSALTTAAIAIVLYFLLGVAMQSGKTDFDPYRFSRRVTYLVVLSFVLIWFGINDEDSRRQHRPSELDISPNAIAPPIAEILRYAMSRFAGRGAVLLWSERQEPWLYVDRVAGDTVLHDRLGPAEFEQPVSRDEALGPVIFDIPRDRGLVCRADRRGFDVVSQPVDPRLAARLKLDRGIVLPISSTDYQGELIVFGVPGLCCDDLRIAEALGIEISTALDRFSVMSMAEIAAVNRAKLGLARDLHDSVAQVLAGSAFRLEALRNWVRSGRDPDAEIVALQEVLRAEQQNVRGFIARLRGVDPGIERGDLVPSVTKLCAHLTRQWAVECSVTFGKTAIPVSVLLEQEIHHLLREAVANAARHGKARNVAIEIMEGGGRLNVTVRDDGRGFEAQGNQGKDAKPWSLHERTKALGGALSLLSTKAGVSVRMELPQDLDA